MDNKLTAANTPPQRPWTPTERPGHAHHVAPVVYLGDTQVDLDTPPNERISLEIRRNEGSPRPQSSFILPDRQFDHEATPQRPRSESFVLPHQVRDASPAGRRRDPSPFRVFQAERTRSPTSPVLSSPRYLTSKSIARGRDSSPLRPIQSQPILRNEDRPSSRTTYQSQSSFNDQEGPDDGANFILPSQRRDAQGSGKRTSQTGDGMDPAFSRLPSPPVSATPIIASTTITLPFISGQKSRRQTNILLINPNSTSSMTQSCLNSLAPSLPPDVTVHGFTAPFPAPSAIESQTDAVLSTATCVKNIVPIANSYDAFLVACFSAHPLIPALREQLSQPVIGIMEAALYASRMLGSRLGVVTTSIRSQLLHNTSIKTTYSLDAFSVGTESSGLSVLDFHDQPREKVHERMANAATRLVQRGADCVCVGCAGMTDLKAPCQDAIAMHDRQATVADGVGIGVQFLVGLVRERLRTSKNGVYNESAELYMRSGMSAT